MFLLLVYYLNIFHLLMDLYLICNFFAHISDVLITFFFLPTT